MKLSINWLKEYIDLKLSTEALIERLTMAGLEVESAGTFGTDTVLELEITPNRPDCLSILGLAREIGAITGKTVKPPRVKAHKTAVIKDLIHIENIKDCRRYIGTLINDVRIDEASTEMKMRLAALGINAINNAVDITNYVLMETGQPLHAFDYDKLAGGKITVRRARDGESLVTLDGIERKLDSSILIIADDQRPVAIAGIMGGKDTQITTATKNILLESAHFDLGLIRRASRSLGLRSDSSYRFERNVNIEGVLTGADRATDLLLLETGGRLAGRAQAGAKATKTSGKVKVRVSEVESLLGIKAAPLKVKSYLTRLGFKLTAIAGGFEVTPPGNRTDIVQDVDVIEEIARMIGFDRLPSRLPVIKTVNISVDKRPREVKGQVRRVLTAGGIDEIITHSMINARMLAKSNLADLPAVRILNPLNLDQELMRPSMLPSMLQAAAVNINRGQKDFRFFEFGKRYFVDGEKETLGILLAGRRSHDWRMSKKDPVEINDLKGVVARVFQAVGINPDYDNNQLAALDPGCSASIKFNGKYLGSLGKIDKKVLNNWDIKNQEIYYAGLHLDEIFALPAKALKYQPISEFPAIVRDVSLSVKKDIPYKKIEEICILKGGDILRSVCFIEQYLGDKIQPGHKGFVFSCQYQSNSRTLREDEVAAVHEGILQSLIHDLGAIRR
jgi:phenylalanyl-tRNA synthetase beta chain